MTDACEAPQGGATLGRPSHGTKIPAEPARHHTQPGSLSRSAFQQQDPSHSSSNTRRTRNDRGETPPSNAPPRAARVRRRDAASSNTSVSAPSEAPPGEPPVTLRRRASRPSEPPALRHRRDSRQRVSSGQVGAPSPRLNPLVRPCPSRRRRENGVRGSYMTARYRSAEKYGPSR